MEETTLIITGWEPGLRKVTFNDLLRRYTILSLEDAKQHVDRVLDGEIVELPVATAAATPLLDALRSIGVKAELRSSSEGSKNGR